MFERKFDLKNIAEIFKLSLNMIKEIIKSSNNQIVKSK